MEKDHTDFEIPLDEVVMLSRLRRKPARHGHHRRRGELEPKGIESLPNKSDERGEYKLLPIILNTEEKSDVEEPEQSLNLPAPKTDSSETDDEIDSCSSLSSFSNMTEFYTMNNIIEDMLFFDDLSLDDIPVNSEDEPVKPLFDCSPYSKEECVVCLSTQESCRKRLCCEQPICDECMSMYIEEKVKNGQVKAISCLVPECSAYIDPSEIIGRLQGESKERYYRFLVDINKNPLVKTCPGCCTIFEIEKEDSSTAMLIKRKSKKIKKGVRVKCNTCSLVWCFVCQAPMHTGLSCKKFRDGDKLLKKWANHKNRDSRPMNAQKCPKCKIFIERNGGCNHMTCSECKKGFCYLCGEGYMSVKFLGGHHSDFSPFGCKYNLYPENAFARKSIRGSILGAKLLAGVLLGALVVAAAGVLVGTSVVTVPAYCGYRYHVYRRRQKRLKTYAKSRKIRAELQGLYVTPPRPLNLVPREPVISDLEFQDNFTQTNFLFQEKSNSGIHVRVGEDDPLFYLQELFMTKEDDEETTKECQEMKQKVEIHVHPGNESSVRDCVTVYHHQDNTTTSGIITQENGIDVLNVTTVVSKAETPENFQRKEKDLSLEPPLPDDVDKRNIKDLDSASVASIGDGNGCFVNIFGKKLQVPVVWDRDKIADGSISLANSKPVGTEDEKESKYPPSLDLLKKSIEENTKKTFNKRKRSQEEGIHVNHPDLVVCSLQPKPCISKSKSLPAPIDITKSNQRHILRSPSVDIDPYYGHIATENIDTPL